MQDNTEVSYREGQLEGIAFVGEILGPFFLQDPLTGDAAAAFAALRGLDVEDASAEWPFVKQEDAHRFLSMMTQGLAAGTSDDDLVWEYRRLFIGPGPKPTPPWGSVYTDRECVVFGKSTLALRAWMREFGIQRMVDEKTPEDHVGLMLVLMAWIARNQPAEVDVYLVEHLLTWSSHFLELMEQAAKHPFYEGLAGLTKASLEGIQAEQGLSVTHPRFYR